MPVRTAIATTLRDADDVLASFITYHLAIGFDHLFLFFDDPEAVIPRYVMDNPRISAYPRNEAHEIAWETTTLFLTPAIARNLSNDVMSRQILNVELALREAFHMDIHWLLHIDIDELFYPGESSIRRHFQHLTDQNVYCARYHNLEGVPQKKEISNYFKEVQLFKINPSDSKNRHLLEQHRSLIKEIPQIPEDFFHFYFRGKAATKVTENALPRGVHNFFVPPGGTGCWPTDGSVVLHYPCCGIGHYVQKYRTLGQFEDKWFGSSKNIGLKAHLKGRDLVGANDPHQVETYYEQNFVLSNEEHANALLAHGLCRKIETPARLITEHESPQMHG